MSIQYTQTLQDTQIINGVEYTKEQLLQGLAQVRTQHNERTGDVFTDTEFLQWAFEQNVAAWYEQNKSIEPVEPSPIAPVRDWAGLSNNILGGSLYPIYERLTQACFLNPATATAQEIANANNIAVAAGKLDQAVAVTRVEEAVAASFQLLIATSNYRFTDEEKELWDSTVASLNFSPTIYLP